jgi:alkanesulfonate monooxygenase SsuD/methylene tetrahydromethanopterin reductase-like flavin-dependent oxidoreductase (luciferase family)
MISTLDVVSGGRVELGIGAGWKQDEWLAFGYGFPSAGVRLAILADHLEIIKRMFEPGHSTYEGKYASVIDAINLPAGIQQPRMPIVIGGNGPNVTWRLAARYADELNLDALSVAKVEAALPIIRQRCEEIGRDPSTLAVSAHLWGDGETFDGEDRRSKLRALASLGISRVMLQGFRAVTDDHLMDRVADDCVAVGMLEAAPAG